MDEGHCARLMKPGDLVVDACAAKFSIVKTCMLLLKHRSFIRCKLHPSHGTKVMPQLTLLYAAQMLSKESDIDGEGHVCSSAEAYVKAAEAIEIQECLDRREVPKGHPPMQSFPTHIQYHLSTYLREREPFRRASNITAYQWSKNGAGTKICTNLDHCLLLKVELQVLL